jgi:hypothetical protein
LSGRAQFKNSAQEARANDRERSTPECLRSLEIDDQLEFVRKFDRQATRLGTFEDLHDVGSRATKVASEIDAIAD